MQVFECRADNCLVLMIDVQERFATAIPSIGPEGAVAAACERLLKGVDLLGVPTLMTRQYPQGLGDTLPRLQAAAPDAISRDKIAFSCLDDDIIKRLLADSDRDEIIVCGVEAHVCVLATVADALHHGYRVTVCADAIASRHPTNVDTATLAMRDLGALVLPVESVLFRWQGLAQGERFKALSKLVR
ncbi:MAG: isochorismatase family protein [Planctomycetota bacterium]